MSTRPKTPREQSKDITDGKTKPHFIGLKSKEVKRQELYAHVIQYRETFSKAQEKQWREQLEVLTNALLSHR